MTIPSLPTPVTRAERSWLWHCPGRLRRLTVGTSTLLVPLLAGAQQDPPGGARPITLDEAVQLAERQSPTTIQARNSQRIAASAVRGVLAQYIPSLTLSAGASRQSGETFFQGKFQPYIGDPWSYSKGFNANLELFDGGRRWFDYRAAQANAVAADATEITQRFTVALNVKQQYFAALAAREREAAAQRQLEQAEQQFKVSAAKTIAGTATRSDSLRAVLQVGTARLAILNAQAALRNANAALTRFVASPAEVTVVTTDTAIVGHIDLDSAALTTLADNGPAVQQAAAALASTHATRRSASTTYFPTLATSYRWTGNNSSQDFNFGGGPGGSSSSLGFTISYALFNNYTREQQILAAKVAENNADATLRDLKLLQRQNLTTYVNAFRTAEQTIELQRLQITSAEEDLRVVQQRYALGASTLLDVLTSEAALDAARVALIQARLDARTAKANIEALIGRDLP